MAPDPPRVGDECLPSVNSSFLTVLNNIDESDTNIDDIDDAINNLTLADGYTLFVGDGNDAPYHYNTSVFDDDDSEPDDTDSDTGNQDLQSQNDEHNSFERHGTLSDESDPQTRLEQRNEEEGNNDLEGCTTSGFENEESNIARPMDIKVDCDQVKAAMIGFTLPPSSIPPWAVGISDQDIASHVNRLLNNSDKK